MTSEPCKHERGFSDAQVVEREFAGTQADTLTSFVQSNTELVKAQADLIEARATLAKVAAIVADLPHQDSRPSTHWADCHKHHYGCLVVKILTTLEPTNQPKGKP